MVFGRYALLEMKGSIDMSFREYAGMPISICFLPSIEADKENAVIPHHPEILMKSADPVPLIVGFNDKEGRLTFASKYGVPVAAENLLETLKQDFTNCVRHDMKADKEKISSICKKVKEFYFGEKEIGKDTIDNVVDMYTDIIFKNFYESFENITNSKYPVYVYEFGFHGRFNYRGCTSSFSSKF
ncbi:hypothetical protein ACFE04_026200 [Oxalis oulophora]